ncbi:hypothetical protein AMATHDRAFT_72830 [Amanita thiersii Skay4041]|uniref:Protein kinase domain-containing protein n=1 Tax=Amanita thiersii Skay4041 TaxID=703135 RepID=A0A2A9P061_9AGAR|nr:hypothetical protein AMATHDRAFT_72830 [Amanita thiersii Skay4041]
MPEFWDSDDDFLPSASDSSLDEDEVNTRVRPFWPAYINIFKSRGFRLETVRDVKEYYTSRGLYYTHQHSPFPDYSRACKIADDDVLCPDAGLPDNLFRGTRVLDGKKVIVKATHICSREYDVIQLLSSPPLRDDPMNHTIPVLDFIEVPKDNLVFIVMEQWSSQLIADEGPCCLRLFLAALRQCLEHAAFMHKNSIAHLDISLRNLLTDFQGHYAYIDYELSRRFDGMDRPFIYGYRGTEVPPECERGEYYDPYKVDVWALAVLILRACKLTGYHVPELMHLIKPMLHEAPEHRPSIFAVLRAFDGMVSRISDHRLWTKCPSSH